MKLTTIIYYYTKQIIKWRAQKIKLGKKIEINIESTGLYVMTKEQL